MAYTVVFLLAFFLPLLETTVLTLPVTTLFLVLLSVKRSDGLPLSVAFVSGMLFDIFSVRLVGVSSSVFLLSVMMIILYKRRFQPQHILFIFLATLFSSVFFLIVLQSFSFDVKLLGKIVSMSLLSVLLWVLIQRKNYEVWAGFS